MDPTISAAFGNLTLGMAQRYNLQAGVDHAVLARMLIQGGDPANFADLQTGSHVPTPQPFVVPNFVSPAGATIK